MYSRKIYRVMGVECFSYTQWDIGVDGYNDYYGVIWLLGGFMNECDKISVSINGNCDFVVEDYDSNKVFEGNLREVPGYMSGLISLVDSNK